MDGRRSLPTARATPPRRGRIAGPPLRCVPAQLRSGERNLNIANMDWEESAETTPAPRSVGTDMWSVLTPAGRGLPERERLELGSPAEDSLAVFDLVAAGQGHPTRTWRGCRSP